MFSRSWLPITFSRAWSSVLCKIFLHLSVEASKILATTNRLHSVVFQRIEVFLFSHIVNANYPSLVGQHRRISNLGRDLRPHCVQSVLTTSVKILPYRPLAWLIRTKYHPHAYHNLSNVIFTEFEVFYKGQWRSPLLGKGFFHHWSSSLPYYYCHYICSLQRKAGTFNTEIFLEIT